jgi:hypothetical protein
MKRYRGGEEVPRGFYIHTRRLASESMKESGLLPGTERDVYCRVPTFGLLVAGPLVGGLYVVFLPLIGFVVLVSAVTVRAFQLGADAVRAFLRVLRPSWSPARALLARGKARGETRKRRDEWAEEVEKQLAQDNEASDNSADRPGHGSVPLQPPRD